jgi:hypothetical protein
MTMNHGVYIYKDGKTFDLRGRKANKLRAELLAGRGGPEVTALVDNGYTGFLGPDGTEWDFEALKPEHFGTR